VYAVKTEIHGKVVMGMLNIGVNPTVQNTSSIKLEVHIFDFTADLYNESITLQLINYIRPEHKFDSIEALTKQLKKDEVFVRDYFSKQ
jgi:riboflavin kinase/FMN adenylyltransferase